MVRCDRALSHVWCIPRIDFGGEAHDSSARHKEEAERAGLNTGDPWDCCVSDHCSFGSRQGGRGESKAARSASMQLFYSGCEVWRSVCMIRKKARRV